VFNLQDGAFTIARDGGKKQAKASLYRPDSNKQDH
jgi:hypothetical protein